jgi:hypothetical protein
MGTTVNIGTGTCRLWVMPVAADPTGVVIPEQAPIIAVLAANPGAGATGCWYNSGTDPAGWRPLVSAAGEGYTLPAVLQRWIDSNRVDECIGLMNDLQPAGLVPSPVGDLTKLLTKILYGVGRQYFMTFGDPAAVVDGETIILKWKDGAEPATVTFALNRSGTYTPGPGEVAIDISGAAVAAEFAGRVQEAFYFGLPGGMGRGNQQFDAYVIVETSFAGQEISGEEYDMSGTAISGGRLSVGAIGYGGAPLPASAIMAIQSSVFEILHAAAVSHMTMEIANGVDPRATQVAPLTVGRMVYPKAIGQLLYTPDGITAFRKTGKPAEDIDGIGYVPLHRQRVTRGTEADEGVLFGYFDSPLLYGNQARRDIRLRFVILGVNTALATKQINLALRLNATANFTMSKNLITVGTPSEGPVTSFFAESGLDYSGLGEVPLLLDRNIPIQSLGSGGDGIAAGGSFGVRIDITIHKPDGIDPLNWSGLGDNTELQKDLRHRRISWVAWFRDRDPAMSLNPSPLACTRGEGYISDLAPGFSDFERIGIVTKAQETSESFWGQVSAIDPASSVEIEYL